MIIPRFWLTQDENTVTINIRAPYCSLKELDVNVDGENFLFACSPYYLRLKLPGKLEDNDNFQSSFDSDKGEFTFTYEKRIAGEYFPDLELITKLLEKKIVVSEGNRKIEILNSSDQNVTGIESKEYDSRYGFGLRGDYNFKHIKSEFKDVFDVDPFEADLQTRRTLRFQEENQKFSKEHYIADYIENDEINELILLKPPWEEETDTVGFNDSELDYLKDLQHIQYNLNQEEGRFVKNGLTDILFAYCYDRRTTYFEGTCESGWTICKLSSSFCWFEGFSTVKEALITAFRRSLIYPLYRSYSLSECVLKDVKNLIRLGAKHVIKCLINMHNIFLGGSCMRYILNNLYIKDYINYIMQCDQKFWNDLIEEVRKVTIRKSDLGLDLIKIEETLKIEEDKLENRLAKLKIKNDGTDSDDDERDSNTTDEETDSSLTTSTDEES